MSAEAFHKPAGVASIDNDVEIINFVTEGGVYCFKTADRRRGDIAKVRTLQPSVLNHDDYYSYMWVQAVQGYFLLRQQFLGGQAQEWRLIREITVEDPGMEFFDEMGDALLAEFEESSFCE